MHERQISLLLLVFCCSFLAGLGCSRTTAADLPKTEKRSDAELGPEFSDQRYKALERDIAGVAEPQRRKMILRALDGRDYRIYGDEIHEAMRLLYEETNSDERQAAVSLALAPVFKRSPQCAQSFEELRMIPADHRGKALSEACPPHGDRLVDPLVAACTAPSDVLIALAMALEARDGGFASQNIHKLAIETVLATEESCLQALVEPSLRAPDEPSPPIPEESEDAPHPTERGRELKPISPTPPERGRELKPISPTPPPLGPEWDLPKTLSGAAWEGDEERSDRLRTELYIKMMKEMGAKKNERTGPLNSPDAPSNAGEVRQVKAGDRFTLENGVCAVVDRVDGVRVYFSAKRRDAQTKGYIGSSRVGPPCGNDMPR